MAFTRPRESGCSMHLIKYGRPADWLLDLVDWLRRTLLGMWVQFCFSRIRGSLGFSAITAYSYYHDLALFNPFLSTVRYVFDRRFYNDSDLPRSIRVPPYFNIKVVRKTFNVFDERKRRIGIPGTELLSFFSGYKKMKFKKKKIQRNLWLPHKV